jgi:tetratricopeptide (TPR) repeat protein
MKLLKVSILAFLTCTALAQLTPQQELRNCLLLDQQARFAEAIETATTAISSGQLTKVDLGRCYILLGFAYHQESKFNDARAAFEQALRIFEHDPDHLTDYAAALNNYAGLYSDAGQFNIAEALWRKSLHVRQQMGDHAGAAQSLSDLAQLANAQRHLRESSKYLKAASEEMKSASDLTDDNRAFFLETQGLVELSEKRPAAAIESFQHALQICRQNLGKNHWLTGWEYILRGKAYAESGDLSASSADMRDGLAILKQALGPKSRKYLFAELAYSKILDQSGSHAEAAQLRESAETAEKDSFGKQCPSCTINVAAFR